MGWESFGVVGFDRGPVLQGRTRILHLQYFFKYVLTYSLHLNSYLVTFLHNTICREQLFCPFLLLGSEFLLNMPFNYHLLYFCTALSLIIMLSSHYYLHKSKTLSQLTQCPFTGTLLLFITGYNWLQSVPAGTGYTALYTCLNNWLQVTKCTGWYWLHNLVQLLQPTGYKSTNRVVATQSLLNSASTQLVTYIKKKKKKTSSCQIDW